MTVPIPEFALILLIGPSGSGKSTFARKHFKATEILSSDFFRGILADDESDQTVSGEAFELVHLVCAKRLAAGRLTVIDATNVRPENRKSFVDLARKYHAQLVALVFDLPVELCHSRNLQRVAERPFGAHVIHRQSQELRRSLNKLDDEGFRRVTVFRNEQEVNAAEIVRYPLPVNKKPDIGPFDIIGDVHGCLTELLALLEKLGYTLRQTESGWQASHLAGRKLVFVGDLCDRGPDTPGVFHLVMEVCQRDAGYCVVGNHDDKLLRWLKGDNVKLSHGLALSVEQFEREPPELREQVREFLIKLPTHLMLDGGRLVVAHAGLTEEMQGRISGKVRAFALYGDTTGESDAFGLPVRRNWAERYRGRAAVVYGHTPALLPEWENRCICIDTGCVFGGRLTALRYPEQELISVPALQEYAVSKRPLQLPEIAIPENTNTKPTVTEHSRLPDRDSRAASYDLPDLADVIGRRTIETPFAGNVVIREENAAAALEAMARFAADPRWLIYLPPTMSPVEASPLSDFLEHPAEAFAYFRKEGIERVVCEQKHMGSRAVAIVCRDQASARRRFHIEGDEAGIVYTRTGRRFFDDSATEAGFLECIRESLTQRDWWARFHTDWFAFDGELMPWSAKAQELLRRQYAATGSAARAALAEVSHAFTHADPEIRESLAELASRFAAKREHANHFVAAYRRYCWPVESLADFKFAPFFLLATEGKTHFDQTHEWHMQTLAELANSLLIATPCHTVDLTDAAQVEAATNWWQGLTDAGDEGMVVKPLDVLARGRRFFVQPALKVRGREYLRIIYGPDYLMPENVSRLKRRSVGAKRGLASREFGLGMEGLERFVRRVPFREVHQCAFAVLALESEPIDPRL